MQSKTKTILIIIAIVVVYLVATHKIDLTSITSNLGKLGGGSGGGGHP